MPIYSDSARPVRRCSIQLVLESPSSGIQSGLAEPSRFVGDIGFGPFKVGSRAALCWLLAYVVLALGMLLCTGTALAQDDSGEVAANQQSTPVAWINEQPVFLNDVETVVDKAVRNRELSGSELELLRASALEQVIGQRLVVRYLRAEKLSASEADLKLAKSRFSDQLERFQQLTLEKYLKKEGLTEAQFEFRNEWRIGWQNYLDQYLTSQNLADYFAEHRQEFDGTQLHAWQIFVKLRGESNSEARKNLLDLQSQLAAGEIDFEEAAQKYSEAPTSESGGDLGWVTRHGELPESVASGLFVLDSNEVSEPIESAYGLHLVRWTEMKPGTRSLDEVLPEVRTAVTKFLFKWIVEQQRPQVQIRFSADYPHFKPGTTELVSPNRDR